MSAQTPRTVYLWQNDMVMTFDTAGGQIEGLQGRLTLALAHRLGLAADGLTSWYTGEWQSGHLAEHGAKGWREVAEARLSGDRSE